MKEIEAIKTGEFMFDDCEDTREFIDSFQSVVYSSYRDYLTDLLILSQNEDVKFALENEFENDSSRRTPEERQKIIIDKIHAQRRHQEHIENGGTEIDDDLDDLDDMDDMDDIDSFNFELFTPKAHH
ncbi:hypothetical protein WB904_004157 [Vibrio parahaemolyticus]